MVNTVKNKDYDKNTLSFWMRKFLWIEKNFLYCLGVAFVIWVVGLSYYIENIIGINVLYELPPNDFAIFFGVALLPLLFIWALLAYIERTASLSANARLFQTYIDSLLYPDDKASHNAKTISTILMDQIKILQAENKEIMEKSSEIKRGLDIRVEELANILQLLDTYSSKTIIDLNDGIKILSDRCNHITNKTNNTVANLKDCSNDISLSSDKFISKINPLIDEISAISSNIKNNIADNKVNLADIKGQLDGCVSISKKHIDEMLIKTNENAQRIEKTFYKTAEECEALYRRLDMGISSVESRVDEQKRLIESQSKVLEHNSELLNNKLSKYGQTVTAEIDKLVKTSIELESLTKRQVQTLKTVNSETVKAIHGIGNNFDERRADIERKSEQAINSMKNVLSAINKETDKLSAFTTLTQAKNADLQNIAETIVDKVGDISGKLALKTDTLKDKAVEVIERFTEASDIIAQSSEKINSSSNNMISSSKKSLSLWEEQKEYIDNALDNIDAINEKLSNLKEGVKESSIEIDNILSGYERQIEIYSKIEKSIMPFEPSVLKIDKDNLGKLSKSIYKTFNEHGILVEQYFANHDMFDLWEEYLKGNHMVFTNALKKSLSRKHLLAIRKAFDDNTEFHNVVIKFLFAMEGLIKELTSPKQMTKNEILNFAVNSSLDKIYFTLIKALNSAE